MIPQTSKNITKFKKKKNDDWKEYYVLDTNIKFIIPYKYKLISMNSICYNIQSDFFVITQQSFFFYSFNS